MTAQATRAPPSRPRGHRALFVLGVVLLVANVVTVAVLWLVRRHDEAETRRAREAATARGMRLQVVTVETTSAVREIALPAELRAFAQSTLYAKTSGYVREVRVERGQRVASGQILATLEAPELERDVLGARADYALKQRTAARLRAQYATGVASGQDMDVAVAEEQVAKETLARLEALQAYTVLRAPFAGVVTARYVDPGALLQAATGSAQASTPLVDLTDTDRLRIFFYVGQDVAAFVTPGDPVTLSQAETKKEIATSVTRTAGAVDAHTRTMQCEIELDNRPWKLLPGTFVQARVRTPVVPTPSIPNESVLVRDGAAFVAVVDGKKVHLARIELGANDGRRARVLGGLRGGETIGINVPVGIGEGAVVEPVPVAQPATSR